MLNADCTAADTIDCAPPAFSMIRDCIIGPTMNEVIPTRNSMTAAPILLFAVTVNSSSTTARAVSAPYRPVSGKRSASRPPITLPKVMPSPASDSRSVTLVPSKPATSVSTGAT